MIRFSPSGESHWHHHRMGRSRQSWESKKWHRNSWTCTCKRDDCLRNDEIRPAAANAAQRTCNVRWLHTICNPPVCFVESVRSGGLSRRTLQANHPITVGRRRPMPRLSHRFCRCSYRPNGGAHSTACVRLSPELIHFLESETWFSWGRCDFRQRGC